MPRVPCPDCDGPLVSIFENRGSGKCSVCHGQGKTLGDEFFDSFNPFGYESTCWQCKGSKQCQTCGGSGEIEGPDSSSSDESLFESKSESEKEVEETDQSDAGDPIEESTSEPEVKESYSSYSGYGGLGYSDYDRRKKKRSKRGRRGRRYRGRGYSSYGGRYSSGSGYGGGLSKGETVGALIVAGLVIAGIVSAVYFVVTFEYKHTPYKPMYLPTITTGPSGTTVQPGAGVASAKAYQAYKDGALFLKQRKYKESIPYFDKAIQLKRDFADAYILRGNAYRELGQYQRAIQDYNEGIRLKPENAFAYSHRALAYAESGQYPRTINDYTQVIRLKPNDTSAYGNRGNAHARLGQYQHAINDYTQAIRLKPDDALSYYNRGASFHSLGQYERAVEDYDEAIRLKPGNADAYKYRNDALKALASLGRTGPGYASPKMQDPSASTESNREASCYEGVWREDQPNQFTWTFSREGNNLHISRNDGFVSGLFTRSGVNWIGRLNWGNGERWDGVVLYRANQTCDEIRTNQRWWFRRY